MEERTELIRVYGMREIATGVGILSQDDPTPWLWGRVGGDVLDLGTLAAGFGRSHQKAERRPGDRGGGRSPGAGPALRPGARRQRGAPEKAAPRIRDYSARRGMPRPPDAMRGVARDFPVPRDMRIPELMRPYPS